MDERNLNVVRVKLIDDTPLFGNELIQTADDAIFLMQKELRNCDRETFCALHLNAKGKPLSMSIISIDFDYSASARSFQSQYLVERFRCHFYAQSSKRRVDPVGRG